MCALYEDGVEIPSDYQGIIFAPLGSEGDWKFSLTREFKEAGFNVDLNKVL